MKILKKHCKYMASNTDISELNLNSDYFIIFLSKKQYLDLLLNTRLHSVMIDFMLSSTTYKKLIANYLCKSKESLSPAGFTIWYLSTIFKLLVISKIFIKATVGNLMIVGIQLQFGQYY